MSDAEILKKKRSLILAGGGIKVAFQAGVLQVWLDEAGLTFDHADGASGGVFNLAMYCQGMTGTQIADNWRNLPPMIYADLNWKAYAKLFYGESILKMDRFRENVFPRWGLDWDAIRASKQEATFNVYNFTRQELEVLTPDMMTEDFLVAGVSLPMWFPPVIIEGNTYIDPVYITDANIEEAIRRCADEIWVIWTVSEKSVWNPGFVANYFQIIEATANGHLGRIVQRIEENNAALTEGKQGEFGRHIEMKILRAEVPLHYLLNVSADRVQEAVNLGVQLGRKWCIEQGIQLTSRVEAEVVDPTTLSFTEEMKGYIAFGETNYARAMREGNQNGTVLMVHLTIKLDGVHHFVTNPKHEATAEGYVRCEALGGKLPIEQGRFNLFVDEGDPTVKKMIYRLYFRDSVGHAITLSGFKLIRDNAHFDVWAATTTLFTRILKGQVEPGEESHAEVVASGVITVHLLEFLKQLTTFRTEGPTLVQRASALSEFGIFFLGKLWDVYGQKILSYGPY
jgi:predicted patatin/cPLA2 family phospholipase